MPGEVAPRVVILTALPLDSMLMSRPTAPEKLCACALIWSAVPEIAMLLETAWLLIAVL